MSKTDTFSTDSEITDLTNTENDERKEKDLETGKFIHGYQCCSGKLKKCTSPIDDAQNYPFCRLKLVVKTFEHST